MNQAEIIRHRLHNQQIVGTSITTPQKLVEKMVAMQSQDWYMALWAIGLRIPGIKEQDVVKAFNDFKIIRTHVLRPTWHFIAPEDTRWLLELTGPRVHALNAFYYKKFELTPALLKKTNTLLTKSLRDNNYLSREALNDVFEKSKIIADRLRLSYIMMYAELEGLICSGPREGKQFTYALVDEVIPQTKKLEKDEALHQLASRYFETRGPATIKDFVWWSGLTVREAKEGIISLTSAFDKFTLGGQEYIFSSGKLADMKKPEATFLIPDYDEYGIGYKDRSIYNHPKWIRHQSTGNAMYYHAISVDGYHGGNWTRQLKGTKLDVDVIPFQLLSKAQLKSIESAKKNYLTFFE